MKRGNRNKDNIEEIKEIKDISKGEGKVLKINIQTSLVTIFSLLEICLKLAVTRKGI